MSYQKKIIELILKSDLSEKEKDELVVAFSSSGEDELKPIIELIEKDPAWINRLYQNYKAKVEAFSKENPDLWDKILKEEEKFLKEEK